jgi:hypothetical protein
VLSGDIHTSFLCDAPIDYGQYDAQTGTGSVAVEFLPSSISRGNFDEQGISGFLAQLVQGAISLANPHHVYSELTSHGYGILDIRPDTVTAEFWYSPILQLSGAETFAKGYRCLSGDNHWQRTATSNPTVGMQDVAATTPIAAMVFPNPAGETCTLRLAKSQLAGGKIDRMRLGPSTIASRQLCILAPYQGPAADGASATSALGCTYICH